MKNIHKRETEILDYEVSMVRHTSDEKSEQQNIPSLESALADDLSTRDLLVHQIKQTQQLVSDLEVKIEDKSQPLKEELKSSLMRTYAVASLIKKKLEKGYSKKILAKLKEMGVSEDEAKKFRKNLDTKKIDATLKTVLQQQKDEAAAEYKTKSTVVNSRYPEVELASDKIKQKESDLTKRLQEIEQSIIQLESERVSLISIVDSSPSSKSGRQTNTYRQEIGELSQSLKTLAHDCESSSSSISLTQKQIQISRDSYSSSTHKFSELKSKLDHQEESVTRLESALRKEAQKFGREAITSGVYKKNIEASSKRMVDIQNEVEQMKKDMETMDSQKQPVEDEITSLQNQIDAEDILLKDALSEIMKLKMLRLDQMKRSRKVFKPVTKRGFQAFEQKIDLSRTVTKLRKTASPFLAAAAEEHERSQKARG
eukprot:TRINITY_DN8863_c0_g1_i1.p1 TRINITY_DN8863_c0_g1~~TRINITY_DN8863_c0_g1_i1.p1  ORF type:complete len:427 (-),score=124.31 TRINITY_DN8863_c0_g1_i1:46-1326(-)